MEILPIGIYGPYPKAGEATSCYLVRGASATIALDFGSGSLSLIQYHINPAKLDAIVLSHLHFDHFCDILPLSYMGVNGLKVYAPASPTDNFSLIKNRKVFDVGVIGSGTVLDIKGIKLEFIPTTHPVECYAVKVTEGDKSFVYTGDTSEIGDLARFCKGTNLIICDCSGREGSPHMTPDGGVELQKQTGVRVVMTHLNPDQNYQSEKISKNLEVIVAGKPILL